MGGSEMDDNYESTNVRSVVTFCEWLVGSFPELAPVLEEHRHEYGEVLPHVFFGDFTRWFVAGYQAGDVARLRQVAEWLDEQYQTADDVVRDLIAVSFLENLPWPPEPNADVADLLGPLLTERLRYMQTWRPSPPS
jgi:hypothetical protein